MTIYNKLENIGSAYQKAELIPFPLDGSYKVPEKSESLVHHAAIPGGNSGRETFIYSEYSNAVYYHQQT